MANDETPEQIYRREVEKALEADDKRLGDVFRYLRDDEYANARSIADSLGISSSGGIHQAIRCVETIIEGRRLPARGTYASSRASRIRGFVKRNRNTGILSPETITKLEDLENEYNREANDEEGIIRENERIERETEKLEDSGIPGIYVYSYPHYMNYPVVSYDEDDTTARTYLKIGRSKNMAERVEEQKRLTPVPEPIMLLRRYTLPGYNGDLENEDLELENEDLTRCLREVERKIHKHLDAADHNRVNKKKGQAGTEWFLTHLPFIDSTAELIGLKIEYDYEEEDEIDG